MHPAFSGAVEPQTDDSEIDDTFSFKSLLKEAVAYKADGERLKESRKALKAGTPMPNADYEQMLADIRRIENAREWTAKASVAMFQVQHCVSCENYSPFFTGLFQRQANRHHRDTDRWIAATEAENQGLPQEIKTNQQDVPFCAFCVGEFGFPVDQLGVVFDEEPTEEETAMTENEEYPQDDAEEFEKDPLALDEAAEYAEEDEEGDADEENESLICQYCNGSGEGQYDGTTCHRCNGTGIECTGEASDDETEPPEPEYTDEAGNSL
jgi:hypothetical protein